MTNTLTKEQMIYDLTKFELEYLVGDPYLIKEMITFFSNGGFNTYTFEELQRQHDIIFND
jgi:hypothetical protein